MKTLQTLESAFLSGKLPKPEYITQMYELHNRLFEYAEFIANRDIEEIVITPNCVRVKAALPATTGGGGVTLLLQRGCERMTPLEILNFRHYERLDSAMIFELVEDGALVFDIGGNIGYYSIALAKGRNATIHAFEPIESTYRQFIANAYYNGVQDRVRINNFGLFDKSGELTFYVYKQDFGNASAAIMHEEKDNEKIVCKVERLDEYVKAQGVERIDFIKLDVEGAEIFALRGGLKSIEKYKPILFVEMLRKWAAKYGYHPNEIIAMLEQIGYICYFACERASEGDLALGNHSADLANFEATADHKSSSAPKQATAVQGEAAAGFFRNPRILEDNQARIFLKQLKQMTEDTTQTNFFFLHKEKHKAYIDHFSLESIF